MNRLIWVSVLSLLSSEVLNAHVDQPAQRGRVTAKNRHDFRRLLEKQEDERREDRRCRRADKTRKKVPTEVWFKIFDSLSTEDIGRLAQTSRFFKQIKNEYFSVRFFDLSRKAFSEEFPDLKDAGPEVLVGAIREMIKAARAEFTDDEVSALETAIQAYEALPEGERPETLEVSIRGDNGILFLERGFGASVSSKIGGSRGGECTYTFKPDIIDLWRGPLFIERLLNQSFPVGSPEAEDHLWVLRSILKKLKSGVSPYHVGSKFKKRLADPQFKNSDQEEKILRLYFLNFPQEQEVMWDVDPDNKSYHLHSLPCLERLLSYDRFRRGLPGGISPEGDSALFHTMLQIPRTALDSRIDAIFPLLPELHLGQVLFARFMGISFYFRDGAPCTSYSSFEHMLLNLLKMKPEEISEKVSLVRQFYTEPFLAQAVLEQLAHLSDEEVQARIKGVNAQEAKLREHFQADSDDGLMFLKAELLSVPSEKLPAILDAIIDQKKVFFRYVSPRAVIDILGKLLKMPPEKIKAQALILEKVLACSEDVIYYNSISVPKYSNYPELVNKLLDLKPEQLEAFNEETPEGEGLYNKLLRLNTFMEKLKEGAAPEK